MISLSKYYYRYVNGDKWIQINGEGNDPKKCKITWECSKNNADIHTIMIQKTTRSPIYGWIEFNDSKLIGDIYTQVLRINPLIRDGYTCKKYDIPYIEPLLPDPQIIIPEKEEKEEKISINKLELSKAVNVNSSSGETGYALIPRSYDKENRKFEDDVVNDLDEWIRNREKNLKDELKSFYGELND